MSGGWSQPPPAWVYVVRFGIDRSVSIVDFRHWYDEIHMPRLLAVPGIAWVSRYETPSEEDADPHFLTMYAITGPDVLESPAYLGLPGWEHWRSAVRDWFRAVYQLRADLGDRGREADR